MDITLFSVVRENHNALDRGIIKGIAFGIMFGLASLGGWLWRKFGGRGWRGLDKEPPTLKYKDGEDNTIPPTE